MLDFFITHYLIGVLAALGVSTVGTAFWLLRWFWKKIRQRPAARPFHRLSYFPHPCPLCDFQRLPLVVLVHYVVLMPQGLPRGTKIRIISGRYRGRTGKVEAAVFQKTVDSDDLSHAFHITLDDGSWVTVRKEQVVAMGKFI